MKQFRQIVLLLSASLSFTLSAHGNQQPEPVLLQGTDTTPAKVVRSFFNAALCCSVKH